MTKLYVKDGAVWKEPNIWTKVNGAWTRVKYGYVKENGVWNRFYPVSGGIEYVGSYGTSSQFSESYTFEVPKGVRVITVTRMVAAGGGGGAGGGRANVAFAYPYLGSGGGGAGYVTNHQLIVTPGSTLTINVGWGGAPDDGGIGFGNPGSAGGNTSITGAESGNITVTGGQLGIGWASDGFPRFERNSSVGGTPNGQNGKRPTTDNYGGAGGDSFSPGLPGNYYVWTLGYRPPRAGYYGSGGGGGGGFATIGSNNQGNYGAPGIVTMVW